MEINIVGQWDRKQKGTTLDRMSENTMKRKGGLTRKMSQKVDHDYGMHHHPAIVESFNATLIIPSRHNSC